MQTAYTKYEIEVETSSKMSSYLQQSPLLIKQVVPIQPLWSHPVHCYTNVYLCSYQCH